MVFVVKLEVSNSLCKPSVLKWREGLNVYICRYKYVDDVLYIGV
jgi:hypothetical protein